MIEENKLLKKEIKELKKEIKILKNDFNNNLLIEHPSITVTELRVCSYLKHGHSSKEIAILMYMSYDGMRKLRHRLRKKFNLHPNDNLIKYIRTF